MRVDLPQNGLKLPKVTSQVVIRGLVTRGLVTSIVQEQWAIVREVFLK